MHLFRLAAPAAGAVALLVSAAAQAAVYNTTPAFPPPGGVTFTPGAGNTVDAGGKTNSYTGFDLSATNDLYFGLAASEGINSKTGLIFDLAASNLAGGIAVYDGATPFGFTGKFVATYTDLGGGALSLTRASLANNGGFSTSQLGGGVSGSDVAVLLVTGNFKVKQEFFLNGIAAAPEFNAWETNNHLSGNSLQASSNGGFYYSENAVGGGAPEPAGWALMIMGFGGIGATMRRRRTAAA